MRLHTLHYRDNPKARVRDTVQVPGPVSTELSQCECTGHRFCLTSFLPGNHKTHGANMAFNICEDLECQNMKTAMKLAVFYIHNSIEVYTTLYYFNIVLREKILFVFTIAICIHHETDDGFTSII